MVFSYPLLYTELAHMKQLKMMPIYHLTVPGAQESGVA